MSATNRGAIRRPLDDYRTPHEAIWPLLPYIPDVGIWEPACGMGSILNVLRRNGHLTADGDDLKYGYDFIKDTTKRECIITNPPFSLAFQFCQVAVDLAPHVFLLLRLNFLASKQRRGWWRRHEPNALFVLSERPSFTPDGRTDATDYAWFYWGDLHKGIHHL